jgi:copper chaperone CopZ
VSITLEDGIVVVEHEAAVSLEALSSAIEGQGFDVVG